MKKLIALLLTLSLLLCMNALVYAAEGDDSGNEPITTVGDASESGVELTTETDNRADPTAEPVETETTARTEESTETETTDPAEESEMPETAEPVEESTAPENTVSTVDSETSQKPTGTVSDGDALRSDDEIPAGDMAIAEPMAMDTEPYNVTITWTGMKFTYHEGTKGEWDPVNMRPGPDGLHSWTSSDESSPTCGTIKVMVNSEITKYTLIMAAFKFDQDESFPSYVQMRFSTDKATVSEGKVTNKLQFNADTGNELNMYVIPASGDLTETDFTESEGKLGNITVTITAQEIHDPFSPEQPGME